MKKIIAFWKWFRENELAFLDALFLGIEADAVYGQFDKKLKAVSTVIGFEIEKALAPGEKSRLVFTACGRKRFFPKIRALVQAAPSLKHFSVVALLPRCHDIDPIKRGTDPPIYYQDYHIRVSELRMALADYCTSRKHLQIVVYIPDYDYLQDYDDLENNVYWIVMQIVGEMAYSKHIKGVQFAELPSDLTGLCPLVELPELIDYLYVVNSRGKTRMV